MKQCGCSKNLSCGCCEGVEALTPQPTANRPGLSALRYRIGTHSTFFETMQARLSGFYLRSSGDGDDKHYPLAGLKTRVTNDASIALLSAAATVFDVLTFYQERIANEGYLRTATERRSVLELGRLVGYTPRPGVAASVFLAFMMDDNSEPVEIPLGARAQSVPLPVKSSADATAQGASLPAELPQSFETSERLEARKEWNDLKPRATRPQKITTLTAKFSSTIYFEGTETNLKPNDPLLFDFGEGKPVFRKVKTVEPLFNEKKTKITLQSSSLNPVATKEVILPVINRYLTNYEAFCIAKQDELLNKSLILLREAKTKISNSATTTESVPQIVGDALNDLKNIIDNSGSAQVQKWLAGLMNELLEILRALSAFDESTLNALIGKTNPATKGHSASAFSSLINLTAPLSLPPSKQPANSLLLDRKVAEIFDFKKDTLPQILTAFNKDIGTKAYQAWANTTVTEPQSVRVYALRVTAQLFGNSVPPRFVRDEKGNIIKTEEPRIVEMIDANNPGGGEVILFQVQQKPFKHEKEGIIYLDTTCDKILPDSWVVVDKRVVDTTGFVNFDRSTNAPEDLLITRAANVTQSVSRSDYDFSGKTTRIDLKEPWIKFLPDADLDESLDAEFRLVRQTVVYAQSEQLELAAEPISYDVCGDRIELGTLYDGLRAGRWIIVSGERTDIPNTTGIKATELVMLSGVEQTYDEALSGDTIHSTLILAKRLAYTFKRDTVKIYGNVVKATHGETRSEVLGSGDATRAMQTFTLKQPPLTFVSAPTPSGIESTLEVRVNDVKWQETDSLAELKPQDRKFITKTSDEAQTSVIFGNGEQGARLPTGVENVKAVYRSGIGKSGNVKAEQISLLLTKPLGVREVINPLRASGGADKETRDQARRNAPMALMALDRLVSTRDYADFARTFAGIGKSSASRLSDGYRQIVHLTIAGAEDIPIDVNSDLYNNLRRALAKYGNPFLPVRVVKRELLALVIAAKIGIHADYLWESVVVKVRAALLDAFSFERRELGQSVFLGEVMSVIQGVEGVVYSDIDVLDGISETELSSETALKDKTDILVKTSSPKPFVKAERARRAKPPEAHILPAQLAYLSPDVPDTLILNQIEEVKK